MLKLFSRKRQKVFIENYRPISTFGVEDFGDNFLQAINNLFDNILSKYQCGFRKGHGTQHSLLLMLGK